MKYFIGIIFALLSLTAGAGTQLPGQTPPRAEKKITIPHVFSRSVKKQMVAINTTVSEDDDGQSDDADVHVFYRRPELVNNSQLTHDQYIGLRLANARRLALETHEKTWGKRNS
jgi:hypothetical protein